MNRGDGGDGGGPEEGGQRKDARRVRRREIEGESKMERDQKRPKLISMNKQYIIEMIMSD